MSLRAWLAQVGWVSEINCGLMAAARVAFTDRRISINYLFAFFTPVGQVLVVTFVAPWFAFHCYKRLSRQRFVAVVTTKMIVMPLLVHGFKNTFLGVDQL